MMQCKGPAKKNVMMELLESIKSNVCTLTVAFLFSSCRNSVLLTMKNILIIRKLST